VRPDHWLFQFAPDRDLFLHSDAGVRPDELQSGLFRADTPDERRNRSAAGRQRSTLFRQAVRRYLRLGIAAADTFRKCSGWVRRILSDGGHSDRSILPVAEDLCLAF